MTERLDVFMARANADYYASRDPFADFVTAPEISQVFGELLGLWAAVCWRTLGAPNPVLLVEAGPGRGTLMVDALRAIEKAAPDFRAALQLHLIETSPRLRAVQAERVPDAVWHDCFEDVPEMPFVLLANEFLDALPIRQFVRRPPGWFERFVGPDGFVERAAAAEDVANAWADDPVHSVRETCPLALALATAIADRCVRLGGAALFVDYGPQHDRPGDSLQAIANREPAHPLAAPGTADLTAHVNFAALAVAAQSVGATVHGPVAQGLFLAQLGLFQRSNQLARRLPPDKAFKTMEAARRLGEPDRMGRLFKAMALSHPVLVTCPGFEAC
jgi:NADH dehydrogenase [ubiquinone] 1 alpha subcomplex assembly factor 7